MRLGSCPWRVRERTCGRSKDPEASLERSRSLEGSEAASLGGAVGFALWPWARGAWLGGGVTRSLHGGPGVQSCSWELPGCRDPGSAERDANPPPGSPGSDEGRVLPTAPRSDPDLSGTPARIQGRGTPSSARAGTSRPSSSGEPGDPPHARTPEPGSRARARVSLEHGVGGSRCPPRRGLASSRGGLGRGVQGREAVGWTLYAAGSHGRPTNVLTENPPGPRAWSFADASHTAGGSRKRRTSCRADPDPDPTPNSGSADRTARGPPEGGAGPLGRSPRDAREPLPPFVGHAQRKWSLHLDVCVDVRSHEARDPRAEARVCVSKMTFSA